MSRIRRLPSPTGQMSPSSRNRENLPLPKRWRFRYGTYYYRVPKGLEAYWDDKSEFPLGRSLSDAHRAFATRVKAYEGGKLLCDQMDRFIVEIIPTLSPRTQKNYIEAVAVLRPIFGKMLPGDFRPHHGYKFMSLRGNSTAGKREMEVMSAILTACVQWGVLDANPLIGQFKPKVKRGTTHIPSDDDIIAALSIRPMRKRGSVLMCQGYIRLKLLTGLRQTDMLLLQIADMKADGIHVRPHKTAQSTGKAVIIEWDYDKSGYSPLKHAVEMCIAARPLDIGQWLFCNSKGECYFDELEGKAHGFSSVWQRFMSRVVAEQGIERFTERSLRNKAATDADTLEAARALLVHADDRTTAKYYRLKPERVTPGKSLPQLGSRSSKNSDL